jgi:hypothetical protein
MSGDGTVGGSGCSITYNGPNDHYALADFIDNIAPPGIVYLPDIVYANFTAKSWLLGPSVRVKSRMTISGGVFDASTKCSALFIMQCYDCALESECHADMYFLNVNDTGACGIHFSLIVSYFADILLQNITINNTVDAR